MTVCRLFLGGSAFSFRKPEVTVVCELVRLISQVIEYTSVHGAVVPHPLRMRKALGSTPRVFTSFACVIMCERIITLKKYNSLKNIESIFFLSNLSAGP